MNNVYNQRDYFNAGSNMCFDNKGMVTPAHSERTAPEPVRINITDADKTVPVPVQTTSKLKIKFRRRIRPQYILNAVISVIALTLVILLEYGYLPGSKLGFVCNDPLISHQYTGDTISPVTLGIGCALLPLLVLLLTEYLKRNTLKKDSIPELWFLYKECLIGGIFILFVTEIAKIIIGEHRPHFLDVCAPDTNKNCVNGTYIATYTCTNEKHSYNFVTDSSRSFPSGHSSVSVFISLFSAYIIQTRLPTAKTGQLLKPFLVAVCLTWGLTCSLTRITDRRHHWWDVLAGVILGMCGAYYTLSMIHKKIKNSDNPPTVSASTTTLLDLKNKNAKSEII